MFESRKARRRLIYLTVILAIICCTQIPLGALAVAAAQKAAEAAEVPEGASEWQDISWLGAGKPISQEIRGGETHQYRIRLDANQFMRVIVEHGGIRMALRLSDPQGKQSLQVDNLNNFLELPAVVIVAETSGDYLLQMHSLEQDARPLQYEVKIGELRAATERDRSLVAAERNARALLMDGQGLLKAGTKKALNDALGKFKEALKLYETADDKTWEGFTLIMIGNVYGTLRQTQQALDYFNRASQLSALIKDKRIQGTALNNMGAVCRDVGQYDTALGYLNDALRLRREAGDKYGEAYTLHVIGTIHHLLGDRGEAIKYFKQVLEHRGDITEELAEYAYNEMGRATDDLGRPLEAIGYYKNAEEIGLGIRDYGGVTFFLFNTGRAYQELGEDYKALEYYTRAQLLAPPSIQQEILAALKNNLGILYGEMGDRQKASEYYNSAREAIGRLNDPRSSAIALVNVARISADAGEYEKAEASLTTAINSFRSLKMIEEQAGALINLGDVYEKLSKQQDALRSFQEAAKLSQGIHAASAEAAALSHLGAIYADMGERQSALDYLKRSVEIVRAVGDPRAEVIYLSNIGVLYMDWGDLRHALEFTVAAIGVAERVRAQARLEEFKSTYDDYFAPLYSRAVVLYMRLGLTADAFNMTERARARVFLDQIGNTRVRPDKALSPKLRDREKQLQSEIYQLQEELLGERLKPQPELNEERIRQLAEAVTTREREYEALMSQMKAIDAKYASLHSMSPLTLSEVAERLDDNTTLLSYFVMPESTLVFIVTRRSLQQVKIPISEADLKSRIRWFHKFASLNDPRPPSMRSLYEILIGPVKEYIKTPVVGVIPHGVLHYVPFAALTDGQHYFGERHTLFTLPSASILTIIQGKSKPVGNQMLAISQSQAASLPALRYADQEAESVAKLYAGDVLTTSKASKSEFLKRAGNYSLIHIAAHTEINTVNPSFSRIILGSDESGNNDPLKLADVYDLDLSKASLVVLSACETELGKLNRGDDVASLNRAFIYAGTPTVITSLWTVDDESTSELMRFFYAHLKQGMAKAEALREAQKDLRETYKKFAHPYYWAAFVLTGDPGLNAQPGESNPR